MPRRRECQEGQDQITKNGTGQGKGLGLWLVAKVLQNFYGCPVAKTLCSHYRRPGCDPWWENY